MTLKLTSVMDSGMYSAFIVACGRVAVVGVWCCGRRARGRRRACRDDRHRTVVENPVRCLPLAEEREVLGDVAHREDQRAAGGAPVAGA
jgi:hypothetical protein